MMKLSNKQQLMAPALCLVVFCSTPADAGKKMADVLNAPKPSMKSQSVDNAESLVQLAILLDSSGSMEGLVDQARCQVWNAISRLAGAERNGKPVRLEIAVYQFGTEFVGKSKGCLRRIIPFSEDIDEVSEALFGIKVAGGDEYCGTAISAATTELKWSTDPRVYKTIVIAGNESFFQGDTTLGEVLPQLSSNNIVMNAIYCGTKYKDDVDGWQAATRIAGGRFAKIDHNQKLPNIKTPFDGQMRELNQEMNETFVWYGQHSQTAANKQIAQDKNTSKMSDHAFAARMSAKIGHLYHHVDHDLVDATVHRKVRLDRMPEEQMPETLRFMKADQRMAFLNQKISDRQSVRRRMADLITKRQTYLQQRMMTKLGKAVPDAFGDALIKTLVEQATALGFEFDEKIVGRD